MAENGTVNNEEVTYGEYKGNPTITLPAGPRGFTFGLSKARAILAYSEEIKAFVKQHEKS
ncbi:MAG: hypothetical protein WCQ99_12095 [Pseudomonadota bacterium]